MADIVLTTLNAKYIHAAFGLRYLLANLGSLQSRACIAEFDINQRPIDIAEALLWRDPKIIGFGIYIWNVAPATELIAMLKRVRPDLLIILGGPEVSFETEEQTIVTLADYVITGEADLKFAEVCGQLLAGKPPAQKVIPADLPDFAQLTLPYHLYNEDDIAHRLIYVEASRGCPYTCEFCLSSLDIPVRQVPLAALLSQLEQLLARGVKHFKFVDRTFNLNVNVSRAILEFCLAQYRAGHFFHFEMVPDRLPVELREVISKFPSGALQFEVGIQTFNRDVGARIKRRQNYERLSDNFRFLRHHTGVHIHADLIVGLPGETLDSFAAGFDELIALEPQEIQVGILKRLRGTPIARHDTEWRMVYNPNPPYEILQNRDIDFTTMQKLRRFARYWDLIGNSGNFIETKPLLWSDSGQSPCRSAFEAFMRCCEWLHLRTRRSDGIALVRLMELLFEYLTRELEHNQNLVTEILARDYQRGGRRDTPVFLRNCQKTQPPASLPSGKAPLVLKRQARHGLALQGKDANIQQ
ncbi:MAG TPA: DUF4080 domain-containing protein [Candidatus Limnocylindrales bacterium]|nr:DUF4080 domain-containing protein [Candidatus Limnocylindrales bacterium]